jgi:hypothetical protein
MPKIHGRIASVHLEDTSSACTSFSGDGSSATLNYSIDAPEVTGFGDNTRQNLPGGILDWEFSMDGFTNMPSATACVAQAVIQAGGTTVLSFGPAGSTTSSCQVILASAVLTEFNMENTTDDAATFSLTAVPRTGSLTFTTYGV